ncbi:hypothetical protein CDAR_585821 [Caerostris darwini]|uniref:Uncharacterized protein n=1 Tax=Caerostris darwini TaxID=1538125 RepID=A0AAV4TLP6_9ARAC|nr:hypothetical protein CDAR_585821 [Caerostris darwini]
MPEAVGHPGSISHYFEDAGSSRAIKKSQRSDAIIPTVFRTEDQQDLFNLNPSPLLDFFPSLLLIIYRISRDQTRAILTPSTTLLAHPSLPSAFLNPFFFVVPWLACIPGVSARGRPSLMVDTSRSKTFLLCEAAPPHFRQNKSHETVANTLRRNNQLHTTLVREWGKLS